MIHSINPANGNHIKSYELHTAEVVDSILQNALAVQTDWASASFDQRAKHLSSLAIQLRKQKKQLAELITLEMGKLIIESRAEIEKCVLACDYYVENSEQFLSEISIKTDASESKVVHQPLGNVLAVMPWNFPFWQVIRCAAPALMAGNSVLLKHASNVPGCAQALERLFLDAGFPENIFSTLLISSDQVEEVVADPRIHAVSLTGSEIAGRSVAAVAGQHLKKSLLELGGSDAFVVLNDADLDAAVYSAIQSRFLNAGQSCIAAKRFIVEEAIADIFVEKFTHAIEKLQPGDPHDESSTLAPMAREDLRETLHRQVTSSVEQGAIRRTGGEALSKAGWYYAATLLDYVEPGMSVYDEETFGPVAVIIRVENEEAALKMANHSRFGLGGSVWTKDVNKGEMFARKMDCGCAFVNGMVKSDPRLPFGGVKHSGYGRELSMLGIHEFVNAKTLWIK